MKDRLLITDELWESLEPLVKQAKHPAGAPPAQGDREFIEAVLFVARTGSPWRDLPPQLGHWHNGTGSKILDFCSHFFHRAGRLISPVR